MIGLTVAVAGDTLGYDFRAYHGAAVRVIAGGSAYDLAYELAGAFGLFFYPPSFVPLILPFGLLPQPAATWVWIAGMLAASAGAALVMPVSSRTRWMLVLLAGLSWPFLYSIKLGQVGPLLLLAFSLAWRWLDCPAGFGVAAGVGAAIKVQPGVLLVWALLARRWSTVAWGSVALLILAVLGTVATGVMGWLDFLGLLAKVSDPIITPQNCTPGAIAWQLGASREVAGVIQVASTLVVAVVVVFAALRLPAPASFMVAVIATQLASPILWDHYAVVLLLPTAWLLDRGRRWAVLIPLATPVFLVGMIPAAVYPIVFFATLAVVVVEGLRMRAASVVDAPRPATEPAVH